MTAEVKNLRPKPHDLAGQFPGSNLPLLLYVERIAKVGLPESFIDLLGLFLKSQLRGGLGMCAQEKGR